MTDENKVKDYHGQPIPPIQKGSVPLPYFWDGGFSNVLPPVDETTLLVTPLALHVHGHDMICPPHDEKVPSIQVTRRTRLPLHYHHLSALTEIAWGSVDRVLEQRFAQGHDHARQFLDRHCLLTVQSVTTAAARASSSE
jgi:hypothetical protein